MKKVLIVLAHPNLSESKINKSLIERATEIPSVSINDLYRKYPDFRIDIETEQELLVEYETIVIQHPLYWYSCPSLLKEWFDKVFVRNFAYGKHGKSLQGKNLVSVVSAGGPENAYCSDGENEYPVRDFLKTFRLTAKFCNMLYLTPLVLHNAYRVTESELASHVEAYSKLLSSYAVSQ